MSNYPVKFGKYLLLERVNVGGMAEVFKAKTFGVAGFERILAIKRILPNLVEDDEFIRMFIDEARIAVQLNHANVVQIYELGKHGDHYYIAMEYLPSRDLRAILDRMRSHGQLMPIQQAAYITKKVCEGLDYAHKKRDGNGAPMNIIHRDVSPQNILIGFEGEVKVIDFGIAKAANRASKTQAGVLKGKFGYMSPEQVRGLPTDRRSDVFAVGVLLYEMLTGERLFIGESDFSTLERVRNAEVIPPTNFNKKVSPELEQIVLKTLAREVEDRYQWASDLAEGLEPFLVEEKQVFSMKRLATALKDMYSAEIALERAKLDEFLKVTADDAKPERGGAPAVSSILPLHAADSLAVGARPPVTPAYDPPPIEPEDAADGFGEDKTFVIEASTAGLMLQNQPTEDPEPGVGVTAVPQGSRSSGSLIIPAVSREGAGPSQQGRVDYDELDPASLYGDESNDDDDSRTLVSAPNPFYEPNQQNGTGEEDDDIDASEVDVEVEPELRSRGNSSLPSASADDIDEDDVPTVARPNDQALQMLRAREAGNRGQVSRSRASFDEDPASAETRTAMSLRVGARSTPNMAATGMTPPRVAASRERSASRPTSSGPSLSDPLRHAPSGLRTGRTPGLDARSAAGLDVGDSDSDDAIETRSAAYGGSSAGPVAAHGQIPPEWMRAMMAGAAASLLLFLIVITVGILKVVGDHGGSTLELFAIGDVKPPSDVSVTIDGRRVGGFGVPLPLVDGRANLVEVTGTGIVPVRRPVRGDGTSKRQPILLQRAPAATRRGASPTGARLPASAVPAPGGQVVSSSAEQPGWRLSLAAVADATGAPVDGAEVFIDARPYGRTPLEAELDAKASTISVRVEKSGFAPSELSIERGGVDRVGPATVRLAAAVGNNQASAAGQPAPSDLAADDVLPERAVFVKDERPDPPPRAETRRAAEPPTLVAPSPPPPSPAVPAASPAGEKKPLPKGPMSPVSIGTQPFADTVIDGKRYGTTPFYGAKRIELALGKHKIEFTDKGTNKRYRFELNIRAADPNNRVTVVLGKGDVATVFGEMTMKALP